MEKKLNKKLLAKFGNDWRVMAPFPCLIEGVSVLILDKGNSRNYEKLQIGIYVPDISDSYVWHTSLSTRNANGFQYQYPSFRGRKGEMLRLNPGQKMSVYLNHPTIFRDYQLIQNMHW